MEPLQRQIRPVYGLHMMPLAHGAGKASIARARVLQEFLKHTCDLQLKGAEGLLVH